MTHFCASCFFLLLACITALLAFDDFLKHQQLLGWIEGVLACLCLVMVLLILSVWWLEEPEESEDAMPEAP